MITGDHFTDLWSLARKERLHWRRTQTGREITPKEERRVQCWTTSQGAHFRFHGKGSAEHLLKDDVPWTTTCCSLPHDPVQLSAERSLCKENSGSSTRTSRWYENSLETVGYESVEEERSHFGAKCYQTKARRESCSNFTFTEGGLFLCNGPG